MSDTEIREEVMAVAATVLPTVNLSPADLALEDARVIKDDGDDLDAGNRAKVQAIILRQMATNVTSHSKEMERMEMQLVRYALKVFARGDWRAINSAWWEFKDGFLPEECTTKLRSMLGDGIEKVLYPLLVAGNGIIDDVIAKGWVLQETIPVVNAMLPDGGDPHPIVEDALAQPSRAAYRKFRNNQGLAWQSRGPSIDRIPGWRHIASKFVDPETGEILGEGTVITLFCKQDAQVAYITQAVSDDGKLVDLHFV